MKHRASKIKVLRKDIDLRVVYEDFDPEKYSTVVCTRCGYATLDSYFGKITEVEKKCIRDEITPRFKSYRDKKTTYTYMDAIQRFSFVLANAVAKKTKYSESAYICLKNAWLLRGAYENYDFETCGMQKKELIAREKIFLQKAYSGFLTAVSTEEFPICGMDKETYNYLLAALAYKNGDDGIAGDMLAKIINNKFVSKRVKDRALELKELLRNGDKS